MSDEIVESVNEVKLGGVDRIWFKSRLFASKLALGLLVLANERKETIEAITNLRKNISAGSVVRTGYADHYTEEHEL